MPSDLMQASQADVAKGQTEGLTAAFFKGLTVGGMAIAGTLGRPKAPSANIESDWEAARGDIRAAIGVHATRLG